jgi:hypothetical protein
LVFPQMASHLIPPVALFLILKYLINSPVASLFCSFQLV